MCLQKDEPIDAANTDKKESISEINNVDIIKTTPSRNKINANYKNRKASVSKTKESIRKKE
ncbi:MAG: hypothetical protein WC868_09415 [Bacteroidales bacterium]